jgi:hypothetical protein
MLTNDDITTVRETETNGDAKGNKVANAKRANAFY